MTVRILTGDAREVLKTLPDESVHCVVTSPPYFGLRDYGNEPSVHGGDPDCDHTWGSLERGKRKDMLPEDRTKSAARSGTDERQSGASHNGGKFCTKCEAWLGTFGNEPTLSLHIEHLVEIFREVRRVLRKDGVCFLNYGDAYTSGNRATFRSGASENKGHTVQDDLPRPPTPDGLKRKDLMMMPARVALALQADGWWLRSMIPLIKTNPMPESATDRPTSAVEYFFLLTKAKTYFYDAVAVRTPYAESSIKRLSQETFDMQGGGPKDSKEGNRSHRKVLENLHRRQPAGWASSPSYENQDPRYQKREKQRGHERRHAGFCDDWDHRAADEQRADGANMRNYLFVSTEPFREAHFATFGTKWIEPWIKAGTSQHGVCSNCGAPWGRRTEKTATGRVRERATGGLGTDIRRETHGLEAVGGQFQEGVRHKTTGWAPTCECRQPDFGAPYPVVPATVLDPFAGSGTVGLVADRLGRDAILIEISETYAAMAKRRIETDAELFSQVTLDTDARSSGSQGAPQELGFALDD